MEVIFFYKLVYNILVQYSFSFHFSHLRTRKTFNNEVLNHNATLSINGIFLIPKKDGVTIYEPVIRTHI